MPPGESDLPVYRLAVRADGEWHEVYGDGPSLRAALAAWEANGDVEGGRLRIDGYSNTADRAPTSIVIERGSIAAMHLTRMY